MKNNLVLCSLILGISIMGSTIIYKTVTPIVKVPKPTTNISVTYFENDDFEWSDVGVQWSLKYKYFNGGLNYIIDLKNININEDISVSENFEELTRVRMIFTDSSNFNVMDDEIINLYEFTTILGTTKFKQSKGFVKMSREIFDLIDQIDLGR